MRVLGMMMRVRLCMMLGGVLMMLMSMDRMAVSHFVMVGSFVVIALFVSFMRFFMMMRGSFMVLCCVMVVIVLGHVN